MVTVIKAKSGIFSIYFPYKYPPELVTSILVLVSCCASQVLNLRVILRHWIYYRRKIVVTAEINNENRESAIVGVKDNGAGIDSETFENFASKSFQGTGLG